MDAHQDLVHPSFPKEGASQFPTFGLEPGGSLDRSIASGTIRDNINKPGAMSNQRREGESILNAVPRGNK